MRFFIFILSFIAYATASTSERFLGWNVPFDWHPAHGHFLKHSNSFSNMTYNGCYSAIDEPGAAECALPTPQICTDNEYYANLGYKTTHPLDPIAAMIQEFYAAFTRKTLQVNTNINDPFGKWVRRVNNKMVPPLDEFVVQRVKEQALKDMGEFLSLVNLLYKSSHFNETHKNNFCLAFAKLFHDGVLDEEKNFALGARIFEAIKADVNPGINEHVTDRLYPTNVIRRVLISYIMDIVTNRADLAKIYQAANLINADRMVADQKPKAIIPQFKESYAEIKERLSKQNGSIEDYIKLFLDYPERHQDYPMRTWLYLDNDNKLLNDDVFRSCVDGAFYPGSLFSQLVCDKQDFIVPNQFTTHIRSQSTLGRSYEAILFRMITTFVLKHFYSPEMIVPTKSKTESNAFIINFALNRLAYVYQLPLENILNQTMGIPVARDWWLRICLPNILGYDTRSNTIINYLKNNGQYEGYINTLMAGDHPERWRFAAYSGLDEHINRIKNALDNPGTPDHLAAQCMIRRSVTDDHLLIAAVLGRQSHIFKLLTDNGKADYWKTDVAAQMPDRPLTRALIKVNTAPIFDLALDNDVNLFTLPDGQKAQPQVILSKLNDLETFELVRKKFNLQKDDLINWHHPAYTEPTSLLDITLDGLTVDKYPLIRHILTNYPEIPVTDQTMLHLLNQALCLCHESTPRTARLIIDRYSGNFDFLNHKTMLQHVDANLTNLQMMTHTKGSLWLYDMMRPKLPDNIKTDQNVLSLNHDVKPFQQWYFLKKGLAQKFITDAIKNALDSDIRDRIIFWMAGYEFGNAPTQDELQRAYLAYPTTTIDPLHQIDKATFEKDFTQDLTNLEIRLGYKRNSHTTIH